MRKTFTELKIFFKSSISNDRLLCLLGYMIRRRISRLKYVWELLSQSYRNAYVESGKQTLLKEFEARMID